MATKGDFPFAPDYASPPGETIQEMLTTVGMTQSDLAKRMGRPVEQVNRLIRGHIAIEPKTALQLERTLGMSASFWLSLDAFYQEQRAREKDDELLSEHIDWLDGFPLTEMCRRGSISSALKSPATVRHVLDFFGVASPGQYQAVQEDYPIACRESQIFRRDEGAVSAWLRYGQREAMKRKLPAYNAKKFQEALVEIRKLAAHPFKNAVSHIHRAFADAGVVVLFIEELPQLRLNGAVQWFGGRPIIQLTNRHKRADVLWFTLYHECGHVILHPENEVFLEGSGERARFEEEADIFAQDRLIDPLAFKEFIAVGRFNISDVTAFAASQGIAAGIVAGRLCHDVEELKKNGYQKYARLREPVDWDDLVYEDDASDVKSLRKITRPKNRRHHGT